jgi:hypothetical protein
VVVPGLALLLYQIIFRRGRKRVAREPGEPSLIRWPGLDSDFYRLEKRLAERGWARAPAEPLLPWLQGVVAAPELASLRSPLEALLRLHYRHRFDPLGLNATDRDTLHRETNRCLELLAQIPATPDK